MSQSERPSWDEYFMTLAAEVATRTTCLRRGVGAIIVKDRRILATGYNGVPTGLAHCSETGCLRQQLGVPSGQRHEICRGLHAEQNAIIQAARYGIDISDSSIYITTHLRKSLSRRAFDVAAFGVRHQGSRVRAIAALGHRVFLQGLAAAAFRRRYDAVCPLT